jgi:hypothetical protein
MTSWDEATRRIANGEPALDVLEGKIAADREKFRAFLADMGQRGVDSLRQYDVALRDLDTGITGARSAWHSVSDQRGVSCWRCSLRRRGAWCGVAPSRRSTCWKVSPCATET